MTGDPIFPESSALSQSPIVISAAGTCDPELMKRYMTGGMALSTDTQDTSNVLTDYWDGGAAPDVATLLRDRSRPTNCGMKNTPRKPTTLQ